jgi:hypothetical protein
MILELIEALLISALNRPQKSDTPVRYLSLEENESAGRLILPTKETQSAYGLSKNETDFLSLFPF